MADIYILFSCDEWKSNDSMQMICASVYPEKMLDVIENEIDEGNMTFYYGNSEEDESLSAFRKFRSEGADLKFINGPLEYGHLEIVEDGEVL